MSDIQIASAVERGITSQSELITSMSLAVIAGLVALLLQLRIHNTSHPDKKIDTAWTPLFYLSLAFCALSICIGYIISGALVQMAPQLFSHKFQKGAKFSDQAIGEAPIGMVQFFSAAQFIVFSIAVICALSYVVRNRK